MAGTKKYQRYPAYQSSYAVWSGDVPEHWVPIRLKHVFREKKKRLNPSLPAGSISFGKVIFKNEDSLAKETKAAYQEVLEGEFLVNPLNMNFDLISLRTALSSINVVVSTGYLVLQSHDDYNKNYLRWLLQQFDVAHMKTLGAGVRQTISFTDIGNSFIFAPALPEQTKIAAFLDYETAKIDGLIAKQQRLIALLEEKRQAVISHAVTKGLDPTAPLRPSGIDWLGDVPEHWEVKNFRYATQIYRGKFGHRPRNDPSLFRGGTLPFIQTGDVAQAEKYIETFKQTLNQKGASVSELFPAGTLVMAIAANIGDTAILNFEAYAPDSVVGFRPGVGVDLEFLRFCFIAALPALEQTSTQSTQANLNIDRIGSVKVAIPPATEQREIAIFLEAISKKHTALNERARSAMTLLKERRTALISAAVTGKIDVRDWQPPEEATVTSSSEISTQDFDQV